MLLTNVKRRIREVHESAFCWLNRRGVVRNAKQRGWGRALAELNRGGLVVLETGRIRNPAWAVSDGNSTHFFSALGSVKKLISIDNDSENFSGYSSSEAYCKSYLSPAQLAKVTFINGDSRAEIPRLSRHTALDVAFLDSANDPELILDELKAVIPFLSRRPAVVIIDDVSAPGKKGALAMPYLESLGHTKCLIKAPPGDCAFFIMR